MIETVLNLSLAVLVISVLLALYRLARGPTLLDRILAFDLIAICAIGMIVVLSMKWRTPLFMELILIFALLGFFGTVAFVFYLHRTFDAETAAIEEAKRRESRSSLK
jgi:multisubunit Na+/H+ antiporter MnhF subunit